MVTPVISGSMTRKHTRRKVWYVRGSGLEIAITGATKTPEADLDKLRVLELSAIETFKTGRATRHEFSHLADMLNLTETFCAMNIGAEALPACAVLQAALIGIRDRSEQGVLMQGTEDDIKAMREVFLWHEEQRKAVDRSTYERAIVKCRNRIHSAHPSRKVLA